MTRTRLLFLTAGLLLVGSVEALGQAPFTSSNLPIIVIDVDQEILNEPKVPGRMGIIDNGAGVRNNLTDPFSGYDGAIGIELRGSSSLMFPKKSFAVETRDEAGGDIDAELLGLPEEEDWVLHGPYSDKSLMRNVLIYETARRMGRYASRSRFFELVLNGQYWGVYVLMERIKRDDNRVDIANLNPDEVTGDDLTGGYILKIDKTEGSEVGGWTSPHPPRPGSADRIFYQYHVPKPSEIVPEQEAYIQQVVATFEDVMAGAGYADPKEGYAKYLDVASAVDFFILNEISKNVDGYRLSTFFYKDKDSNGGGKLVMGPIWDFNLGFGNADYYDGGPVERFMVNFRVPDGDFQFPFWWKKLWDEPAFNEALRRRWHALRSTTLRTDSLLLRIDATAALLDEAQQRNFTRWPVLGEYVWPNAVVEGSYGGELVYLKTWIRDRLGWIDAMLPPVPTAVASDPARPEAFQLVGPYPNPFRSQAQLTLSVAQPQHIVVEVFDLMGRRVRVLHRGPMQAGSSYRFDIEAAGLPNGLYLIRAAGATFEATRRVLLVQ